MNRSSVRKSIRTPVAKPAISTAGEIFSDGTFLELVHTNASRSPNLLLWSGSGQAVVADTVKYLGRSYAPCTLHGSVLRSLKLPSRVGSPAPIRNLLAEICNLVGHFTALTEKSVALIGRFVLGTWILEAMPIAPRLLIEAYDAVRARQLFQVLHCMCRRALPITAVTPAAFCSIPAGMCFTLLLNQTTVSTKLSDLLDAALLRANPILRGGELLDLYGAQVILRDATFNGGAWPAGSVSVSCIPGGRRLPSLDEATQARITEDFQSKLLAYRFAHYEKARTSTCDAGDFAIPLRDAATSLAMATPGDTELHGELAELLAEENAAAASANWINPDTVIAESILVLCREAKLQFAYVAAIGEMATKILAGRGESRKLDPGEVGRRIRNLGFATEPRDARGVKLRLTTAICERAHDLAHQLGAPAVHACADCKDVGIQGM